MFAAALARRLGTYKERDKLENYQNFKKGDKTCSKVWSPDMDVNNIRLLLDYQLSVHLFIKQSLTSFQNPI